MPSPVLAVLDRGRLDPLQPALHADELGFLRGDGCFETAAVLPGHDPLARVLLLDAHLDRLDRSVVALDMAPLPHGRWRALVAEAVGAWPARVEGALRLVHSRGVAATGAPTCMALVSEVPASVLTQRHSGVAVVTLSAGRPRAGSDDAPWLLRGAKTLSYAVNMAILREAGRRGADDALLVSTDGYVLEAPTASVVWWASGVLSTTPVRGSGILAGTTQSAVFDAAADAGVATSYDWVDGETLASAEAVWLASSVRGLTPVVAIDGRPVSTRPGLHEALHRAARAEADPGAVRAAASPLPNR